MGEIKRGKLVKIDDVSYAIPITVLTGEVVQQLGERFIFDAASLNAPESCALDYNHNDDEIIGRCESFTIDKLTGEVNAVAVLVGRDDLPSARVNEVLANLQAGVPYEVSPFIDLTEAEPVVVEDGETVAIHGREENGALTVWRGARIRGVAICPHGADGGTSFVALKFKEQSIKLGETKMDEQTTQTRQERIVDPELTELINEFGKERGLDYYLEGFTLEEARADDYEQLKALNQKQEEKVEEEKKDEIAELSARVDKLAKLVALSTKRGDVGASPSVERESEKKLNPIFRAAEKFKRNGSRQVE